MTPSDASPPKSLSLRAAKVCLARPISKYVIAYVVACLTVLGGAFLISGAQINADWYQTHPVDFHVMSPSEVVITSSLLEHHIAPVKLDYALQPGRAPDIALYGHHIIRDLSGDAFDRVLPSGSFFNYGLEHLSLRDTLNLMRRQAEAGTFPRKLALVHLSSPAYPKFLSLDEKLVSPFGGKAKHFAWIKAQFAKARRRIDWQGVVSGLFKIGSPDCYRYGIVDRFSVMTTITSPVWLDRLSPVLGRRMTESVRQYYLSRCPMAQVIEENGVRGYRFDGAAVGWTVPSRTAKVALAAKIEQVWSQEDGAALLDTLREIDTLAKSRGIRVVFFIPPDPWGITAKPGSAAFEHSLEQAREDGMALLDYRGQANQSWLTDGAHVNDRFFARLLSDIRDRLDLDVRANHAL